MDTISISRSAQERRRDKIEKGEKLNLIRKKLASLSEAEKQSLISRGLIATIEGRTLSVYNTILVYLQPNGLATSVVGGYRQWLKAGRQVKKGEHGFTILIPVGKKDEGTGDIIEVARFYPATVFDISQTEIKEEK